MLEPGETVQVDHLLKDVAPEFRYAFLTAGRLKGAATPGHAVRRLRDETGYSVRELAKRIGYSGAHLSLIENGSKALTPEILDLLAREVDLSPGEKRDLYCAAALDHLRRYKWDVEAVVDHIRGIADRPATFGELLREYRKEQSVSLAVLAEKLGVHPSYAYKLEQDEARPSIDLIEKAARVCGVDDAVLFRRVLAGVGNTERKRAGST